MVIFPFNYLRHCMQSSIVPVLSHIPTNNDIQSPSFSTSLPTLNTCYFPFVCYLVVATTLVLCVAVAHCRGFALGFSSGQEYYASILITCLALAQLFFLCYWASSVQWCDFLSFLLHHKQLFHLHDCILCYSEV